MKTLLALCLLAVGFASFGATSAQARDNNRFARHHRHHHHHHHHHHA